MKPIKTQALLSVVLCSFVVHAADAIWSGADATWTDPDADSFNTPYTAGDNVIFGSTGVGAVNVSSGVAPGSITFNHATGTYVLSGTAFNAGSSPLSITGAGTAQFGNLTTTAYSGIWGATQISGGGTLAYTRGNHIGSSGSTITLDNGTLRLAADNTATYTHDNPISVAAGGGAILAVSTANRTNFQLTGNITGGASAVLNLRNSATSGTLSDNGLILAGADNSGFAGNVVISTPTASPLGSVSFASTASLFSGASSVIVRDGGIAAFQFAVSTANLGNFSIQRGGGIGARGAAGSFGSIADPMAFVGSGGSLLLDNQATLLADRIADGSALQLDNNRLILVGRNASNAALTEVISSLSYTGGCLVNLDQTSVNSSGVDLSMGTLETPSLGDTLLVQTDSGRFGSGVSLDTLVVTGAGKPAVTNGMISPGIQVHGGANLLGDFTTFSGDDLATASASYTSYAADWSAAGPAEIVNLTAATTLTGSGTLDIHALRVTTGTQNLGGRTVRLGSGGLILSSVTVSNGTIDFGGAPGFIGAYNAAAQGTITASLAGSGGITVMGTSQSLGLNNGTNTFTGGLHINGGNVALSNNAANGNNVTVNALARLMAGNFSGVSHNPNVGGLSGAGRISAWFQNASPSQTIRITPAVSTTHTFSGSVSNGEGGRILSLEKNGAGTQVFTSTVTASHTGSTTVNAGALIVNANLGSATGNVSVASAATLGGSGKLGGAASVTGSLAPGDGIGTLTFANSVTWNGAAAGGSATDWKYQLGAANSADRIAITGDFLKNDNAGANPVFRFDFQGSTATGSFVLASWTGSTTFSSGDFSSTNLGAGNSVTFSIVGNQLIATVTGSGGTPYDTWAAGPFSLPFTNTDPVVDFDQDGLANLLEFVLGGDPTVSQPGIAPSATATGANLVLSFNRSDASELQPVAVVVEVSADLATWNPADQVGIGAGSGSGPNGVTCTVTENGSAPDTITVTIPKNGALRKFARVSAIH